MIRFLPLERLRPSAMVMNPELLAGISYQDAISDTETSIPHISMKLWLPLRERTGIWSQ